MAISNHERVRKGLELLRKGLAPFVEREIQAREPGKDPAQAARRYLGDARELAGRPIGEWDAQRS